MTYAHDVPFPLWSALRGYGFEEDIRVGPADLKVVTKTGTAASR